MSRAAKLTFAGSVAVSGFVLWGVHFMQVAEREVRLTKLFRLPEIPSADFEPVRRNATGHVPGRPQRRRTPTQTEGADGPRSRIRRAEAPSSVPRVGPGRQPSRRSEAGASRGGARRPKGRDPVRWLQNVFVTDDHGPLQAWTGFPSAQQEDTRMYQRRYQGQSPTQIIATVTADRSSVSFDRVSLASRPFATAPVDPAHGSVTIA